MSPIYKKNDRQDDNNYRPISLLSSIGKALERLVFIKLYEYCTQHNLLTWRNSGYKQGDSTINQLVYITHKIYTALRDGLDVCFVSLDASSAFDRVWHKGLLHKLQSFGIKGVLLKWFESYLTDRQQRVVISGSCSEWIHIKSGVPQGSILGPLLFLIYINDIVDNIRSDILLFADDTSLLKPITDPDQSIQDINSDLQLLKDWSEQWLVNFNPTKTKYMIFTKKLQKVNYKALYLGEQKIDKVSNHKQLGITFADDLSWDNHINQICTKASTKIDAIKRLPSNISPLTKLNIYTTFIRPLLEYGSVLYDSCTDILSDKLEHVQRQALLAITRAYKHTPQSNLLSELGLESLQERRRRAKTTLLFKMKNNTTPLYLSTLLTNQKSARRTQETRQKHTFIIPKCKNKAYYLKSFLPSTIKLWNNLPKNLICLSDLDLFKHELIKLANTSSPNKSLLSFNSDGHIHILRMRLGLSGLNSHRKKFHFIPHSTCDYCQSPREDINHYFLHCTGHAAHRGDMLGQMGLLLPQHNHLFVNLTKKSHQNELCTIMIKGINDSDIDIKIFKIVSTFIERTKRFSFDH